MADVPPQYRAQDDAPRVPVSVAIAHEALAREAERCAAVCSVINCEEQCAQDDKSFCPKHSWYLRVVLADERYRTQPVPRLVVAGRDHGAQEVML